MQLTNSDRKLYADLDRARTRRETGLFMAEGTKCMIDTLPHFDLVRLCATDKWLAEHPLSRSLEATPVKRADLERMTHLSTPPEVIAVYRIPQVTLDDALVAEGLTLALDRVQDPGNLGTIVRLADWFGVKQVVCSPDTVDVWSPKVVQATMGAVARVKCIYMPLSELIERHREVPVYGTFLDGDDIYSAPLPDRAIVVMGNEGQGISQEVGAMVTRRILIPSYPAGVPTSESLNVSMATAITLSEFRRPKQK